LNVTFSSGAVASARARGAIDVLARKIATVRSADGRTMHAVPNEFQQTDSGVIL